MGVVDAPLISSLRPASHLYSMDLLACHFFRLDCLAKAEDEDAGRVRIGHQDSVAGVFVIEPRQVIQVWLVVYVDPVLFDWRRQLQRVEEIGCARAGKYRYAVCSRGEFFLDIGKDPLHVMIEALPLRGAAGPSS